MKAYDAKLLASAPASFRHKKYIGREFEGYETTVQVAPEDCTGCALCIEVCPAKDKQEPKHKAINMEFQPPIRERERENYDFFLSLLRRIAAS